VRRLRKVDVHDGNESVSVMVLNELFLHFTVVFRAEFPEPANFAEFF